MLFQKKEEKQKENLLLRKDNGSLIHENFESNLENKLMYARGAKGKIFPGKQFLVEIIFKPLDIPCNPYTNWATLISNFNDKRQGMVLQQNDTSRTKYLFSFLNGGIVCPVVLNTWNYLAFQVDNNFITAYSNGNLVGRVKVENSYEDSEEPLYIGNFRNTFGFFFGDIKELKISKNIISDNNAKENWNNIITKIN